ncbi:hypothetical protein ACRAQ7_01295 [Erythrobacter sp. W53]|uniref:hypothetical protein n=1 Tax=Erythrobacter sp. W53 TaxID=3425947 RepID=UPI003D767641
MQTRLIISAFLVLCALGFGVSAAPIAHAQSVQQFELPPAPTPSETPQVQGPVDIDGPVPVAPRAIETDPPASSPTPTETFEPILTAPGDDAQAEAPARVEQDQNRSSSRSAGPATAPAPQAITDADGLTPSPERSPGVIEPPQAPATAPPVRAAEAEETAALSSQFWLWIAGVTALLLAAAGVYVLRRSKPSKPAPTIAPPIARPEKSERGVPATDTSSPAATEPLSVQVEVISLSRSLMNATLAYRVTVLNKTNEAVSNIVLGADLTSAGQGRPLEQQVALPDTALPIRHETPRMSAGQSKRFEGQVQLPLNQAVAIRQGKTALLVPLLRLRLTADGAQPLVKTLIIGQAGVNSGLGGNTRLQPFALDDGPRSWSPIAHRQLDALS